jgi:hypothetical protein
MPGENFQVQYVCNPKLRFPQTILMKRDGALPFTMGQNMNGGQSEVGDAKFKRQQDASGKNATTD